MSEQVRYAIIRTGGKQHRVIEGETVDVEKLPAEVGEEVEFSEVLFCRSQQSTKVGKPIVEGCLVKGEVVELVKAPKIRSLKYRPRQHTQKNWGHRQHYHRVRIREIVEG